MRISSQKNWRNRYLFVLSQNILNPNNKLKAKIKYNEETNSRIRYWNQ